MTAGRRTEEWRAKHADEAIPQRVKARIFLRDGGRCQSCTRKVGPGGEPYAFDHIVALVNGGEHRENNIQLLCQNPCHARKTATDVAEKSRVYRKRVKHLGMAKAKGRGFDKRFRRRMDGTVERRDAAASPERN